MYPMAEARCDQFTVAIVLDVVRRAVGAVVDSVSDIVTLPAGAIRPTPEFASATLDASYISGLAEVEERLVVRLDIERLMTGADMALVDSARHSDRPPTPALTRTSEPS